MQIIEVPYPIGMWMMTSPGTFFTRFRDIAGGGAAEKNSIKLSVLYTTDRIAIFFVGGGPTHVTSTVKKEPVPGIKIII